MQKFLKSSEYLKLKTKYEATHFKLGGDYVRYDGDKIEIKSAAKTAEYFKNKKVVITETTEDDDGESHIKMKSKTFYQIWSEDPKMKEFEEVVFNCDTKSVKDYQFNLFDGFAIEKYKYDKNANINNLKIKLEKINDHIASLCNYNKSHVNLVKWYMAHMLKKPHELPAMCLVFISKEGVGKDLFAEMNENLLGDKYTFNVDKLDSIVGKFNTTMAAKILGVVNETDPVDCSQRRDNIKFVISAKKLYIEGKYKDPVKTLNYCRLMFFANRYCAFPVEKGSRRPYVIHCSDKYLSENIGADANKKHFTELANIINDRDVLKLFYEELMKIDVENFNFKEIEKSELHKILEDSAKPPLVEFVTEIICQHSKKKEFRCYTTDLLASYTEFLKKRNMRFECSQKNFNVDLQQTFKVAKRGSMGRPKFIFDIEEIKKILLKEYKIDVDKEEEDEDDEDDDDEKDEVEKTDLSVKATLDEQIEHYTKLLKDLKQQKLEELENKMKERIISNKKIVPKKGFDKYVKHKEVNINVFKQKKEFHDEPKKTFEDEEDYNEVKQNIFKEFFS